MAKFNKENSIITQNNCGHAAYSMTNKSKLVTQVLTTFFSEEKFYGDNTKDLIKNAKEVCTKDPKFVSNLARYARKEFHLRSVSHFLTCVVANTVESKQYIKKTVDDVVERADDLLEILACYLQYFGKPIPNGLKKVLSSNLKKFNEFQISKYSGGSKSVKFKDILMLCHTKPGNEKQKDLFKRILEDKLEIATRWETEVSTKGNNSETWESLIQNNQLGYMALLRNLRNILTSRVSSDSISKIVTKLIDKDEVLRSKQLPFRFFSAYKEIENCDFDSFDKGMILNAIEIALEISCDNIDKIPGKTIIAIDNSGSMGSYLSSKSKVTCSDVAKILGSIADKICENSIVLTFANHWRNENGVKSYNFLKKDSIIGRLNRFDDCNGGTPMEAPFNYILKNHLIADRIIVLSDNETNWRKETIQSYADKVRREVNADFWVHAIDLQGYGTQQFYGNKFNLIAGWSEKVLGFVNLAENGVETLISKIENYE